MDTVRGRLVSGSYDKTLKIWGESRPSMPSNKAPNKLPKIGFWEILGQHGKIQGKIHELTLFTI